MAEHNSLERIVRVLAFMSITAFAIYIFKETSTTITPFFEQLSKDGKIVLPNETFVLFDSFFPIDFLNKLWGQINIAFIPSTMGLDPLSWWQMFSFLADAAPIYAVWVLESNRLANKWSIAYLPSIWAQIFQVIGGCIAAPFYYLGHLLTASPASIMTKTSRSVEINNARTLLVSMLLTYYVPFLGAYLSPLNYTRHWWTWLWQMFPIWIGISQLVLSRILSVLNTGKRPSGNGPLNDLVWIRVTVIVTAGFSALVWFYTSLYAPYSLRNIFVPQSLIRRDTPLGALCNMLQYDHVLFFGASLLWLFFLAADLHRAGFSKVGWSMWALLLAPLVCVVGPGAAVSVGWLIREELLVRAFNGASNLDKKSR